MAEEMVVAPSDVVKFVGFGAPAEAIAQQAASQRAMDQARAERIERVKRHKNKKAAEATRRANSLLADLGLSKAERRAIGQRQRKSSAQQKPSNYRWDPNANVNVAVPSAK